MPYADKLENAAIAKIPYDSKTSDSCNCGCTHDEHKHNHEHGYWAPGCPPGCPPAWTPGCPPPPPYPYPYPYPCPPVNPGVGSIEAQITKLSKKASVIRKMIENLINRNKPIVINIGMGASYNFGCYLNAEQTETDYGKSVLEMLQTELEAIKAKIVELTAELEVADESTGAIEETVV